MFCSADGVPGRCFPLLEVHPKKITRRAAMTALLPAMLERTRPITR